MFTVAAPDDEGGTSFDLCCHRFDLTDASVDITVYQESNKTRESAVGMASTLVDIGLVIIRVDPNSGEPLECIGTAKKDIMPEVTTSILTRSWCFIFHYQVNTELFLKRGETYRIVPLSFSHSMELGHRRSKILTESGATSSSILPQVRWRYIHHMH